MELVLTAGIVSVADQGVKFLVRKSRWQVVPLGPVGGLQMVPGRLWLARTLESRWKPLCLWGVSAATLTVAAAALPSSAVYVGLLLGGSFSNVAESSIRGSVTDFVCLRFWPAFNVADAALAAGAVGVTVELLRTICAIAG